MACRFHPWAPGEAAQGKFVGRKAKAIGTTLRDNVIELGDAQIRFVPANDGRGDGLAAADLVATDRSRAGEVLSICDFEFRLV